MARLCLTLTESTVNANLQVYRRYRGRCDLVELRCDYLAETEYEAIPSFPSKVDIPVILTVRRQRDGGRFTENEDRRGRLLERGLAGAFSYIDLEDDLRGTRLEERAAAAGVRVIRSLHDFRGIPRDLSQRMRSWASAGELPKAAVTVNGSIGLENLLDIYPELSDVKQYILLGMGDYGFSTRVLAGRLGSAVTFCSAPGYEAAPGHADIETMDGLYGLRGINRDTEVFGILGRPAMHSRSPGIHNPAFRHYGLNAVYLPWETDDLDAFFRIAERIGIRGFSVTMPFKTDIIPRLYRVSEEVEAVGACNTVVRKEDRWVGYNTDVGGFLEALKPYFPGSLRGVRTGVIGAGGAAAGAVYGLVREGSDVTVFNRTAGKAEACARRYGCRCGTIADFESSDRYDLIVQATSVGMHPGEGEDPAPGYVFDGTEVVHDMIYTPEETAFLGRARASGCRGINGLPMLHAQGRLQFLYFTGREYPPEAVMDKRG